MTHPSFPPLSRTLYQDLRGLRHRQEREERQLFVAEGEHLCEEALKERILVDSVVVASDANESMTTLANSFVQRGVPVFQTSPQKFELLCDAKTPQRILVVVRYPALPLLPDKPAIVLDGIADPGNVGTIIRTADWFGFRQIILSSNSADRYQPKVVRASMGSVFRCALHVSGSLAEILRAEFPQHRLLGAVATASPSLNELHLPDLYAIILGSEARGISSELLPLLHQQFAIHGSHNAESLNVGIAAGIILHHCFSVAQKSSTM